MGNIKLTICKKICKECPFSTNSLPGYLDYHTPEEIMDDMNREIPFSCHLQRTDSQHRNMIELENGTQNVCRGYIATSVKTAKMYGRNPLYGEEMRRLQLEITQEDKDKVFNMWKWKEHHESDF